MLECSDGAVDQRKTVPMRNAMNEVLRDWYVGDCQAGVTRWNKLLERTGCRSACACRTASSTPGRDVLRRQHFDPDGARLSDEEWERRKHEWLPSSATSEYLHSIMAEPVYKAGAVRQLHRAAARGINRQPIDFEYVRTEQ